MSLFDACVDPFDEGCKFFGRDDAKKVDVGIWISVSTSQRAADIGSFKTRLKATGLQNLLKHAELRQITL